MQTATPEELAHYANADSGWLAECINRPPLDRRTPRRLRQAGFGLAATPEDPWKPDTIQTVAQVFGLRTSFDSTAAASGSEFPRSTAKPGPGRVALQGAAESQAGLSRAITGFPALARFAPRPLFLDLADQVSTHLREGMIKVALVGGGHEVRPSR